jgi:hypothetical protein
MNRYTPALPAVLLIAASVVSANPARAQSQDWVPTGCTGDYVCSDVSSVVSMWPLERWTQVRRAPRQLTSTSTEPVAQAGTTTR